MLPAAAALGGAAVAGTSQVSLQTGMGNFCLKIVVTGVSLPMSMFAVGVICGGILGAVAAVKYIRNNKKHD